jgi:hypothetical protein
MRQNSPAFNSIIKGREIIMEEKQKVRGKIIRNNNKKTPMAIVIIILFGVIAVMGVLLFRVFSTLTGLLEKYF